MPRGLKRLYKQMKTSEFVLFAWDETKCNKKKLYLETMIIIKYVTVLTPVSCVYVVCLYGAL